jgi:beta-galactosidase
MPKWVTFDDDWRFWRGEAEGAEAPGFDDTTWRMQDTPHDWSIEDLPQDERSVNNPATSGPFDKEASAGGFMVGWAVGGTGWYRKHFRAPEEISDGGRWEVWFDGSYRDTDAWLNGVSLGPTHHGGYTPFRYDLTPHLIPGDNVLAVRVKNEGHNSRWYSGSGLLRHVSLVASPGPVRIAPDGGVFVTTETLDTKHATVRVAVEIEGETETPLRVRVRLLDPDGGEAVTGEAQAGEPVRLTVDNPRPWHPDQPALYRAEVSLLPTDQDTELDRAEATFGIRTLVLDADRGLLLNGERILLKGGCLHHDNGILGAAAIDRAEERRVELLKAAGFNAIRTAHNAPSPACLDACDRRGVMVMDEIFDEWLRPKTPQGQARYFADGGADTEIAAIVRRDRNHPSVVLWSVGNEVFEAFERPDIARDLRTSVRRHDTTRPVTAGVCAPWWTPSEGFSWVDWQTSSDSAFENLDVAGYNYEWPQYEPDRARNPRRVIVGSEAYAKDIFDAWQLVEKHPWVLGDFVWTAIDYLGESSIGQTLIEPDGIVGFTFPFHTAVCADLDLIGRRKPQSYFHEAVWHPGVLHLAVVAPLLPGQRLHNEGWSIKWGWPLHLRDHWTFPGHEGETLSVVAYASCARVRLSLNGVDLGELAATRTERYTATFEVLYAPGELRAVGYDANGDVVAEHILRTAGPPVGLALAPDQTVLHAGNRNDLSFVTITIVDAAGIPVPETFPGTNLPVQVTVTGPGELAALGSADPLDVSTLRGPMRRAYRGVLQAVIRPTSGGSRGPITLHAKVDTLAPAEISLSAE